MRKKKSEGVAVLGFERKSIAPIFVEALLLLYFFRKRKFGRLREREREREIDRLSSLSLLKTNGKVFCFPRLPRSQRERERDPTEISKRYRRHAFEYTTQSGSVGGGGGW
jgi:hypothetical protein